jgi:ankyrin repeat protein
VRADKSELFDWLLARGADARARSEHNETALHLAAAHGRAREVALLLAHGADASALNEDGMGVAHYAALAGELSVLRELAAAEGAAGAQVRSQLDAPNGRGDTPLLLAARRGHAPTCAWLLGEGARADAVGSKGETAAALAVRARSYATLALMLSAGASPTLANAKGETPFHHAARAGSTRSLVALAWAVSHGLGRPAAVALPDGELALAEAVGHGPGREAVRQAVNAKNLKARTPLLLHARTHGRTELATALIALGADPAAAAADGKTADELMALADAEADGEEDDHADADADADRR